MTNKITDDSIFEPYLPIIDALREKHGMNVEFIDLRDISGFADAFIIATARSETNARTLRDAAEDAMDGLGMTYKIEGETSSRWLLIDAGDLLVHIFSREGREFYNIEDRIWGDAPRKDFEDED